MRSSLAVLAAVSAFVLAPAASAATYITENSGLDGRITWVFGNDDIGAAGSFSDLFNLPTGPGLLTITITEAALDAINNVEFTSVLLNGVAATLTSGPGGEPDGAFRLGQATAGGINTLVVNGTNGGNGVYSGTAAFARAAPPIPEPATWAMLLLGFGVIGYGMRRRSQGQAGTARTDVRFAF